MVESEAHENGRCAFHDGVSIDANPYSAQTQNYSHCQWQRGWFEANNSLARHNQQKG